MFRAELVFFLRKRLALLGSLAVAAATVFGVFSLSGTDPFSFRDMRLTSTLSAMGAARSAAVAGVLAVGLVALLWLSRDKRSRTEALVLSAADGTRLLLSRVAVLTLYALALCALCVLVTLITWVAASLTANLGALLQAVLLVTLPALVLSLLLCTGLYLLFDSLDAAFLGLGTLFFISLLSGDYRLRWVTTHVNWFSDFAGSDMLAPPMAFGRLIACLCFGSLFLHGLLAMRRYGYGAHDSLRTRRSRGALGVLAAVLTAGCVAAYLAEPFVDRNSPLLKQTEISRWGTTEDTPTVNEAGGLRMKSLRSDALLDTEHSRITATATYILESAANTREISFDINSGLNVEHVLVDGAPGRFSLEKGSLTVLLPAGASEITVSYGGGIKSPSLQSLAGYIGRDSVYLQEGSNWLPRPRGLADAAFALTGSITAQEHLTFAVPGRLAELEEQNSLRTWHYAMEIREVDVALYGGVYETRSFQAAGVPVELYVSHGHMEASLGRDIPSVVEDIVAFYTDALGPYPFDTPLRVVETSLYKGGGHSSLNLVTAAETVFHMKKPGADTEASMASFAWMNAVDLLAHEIAHQWWGSGVTAAYEPPWSDEGLASFMANAYIAHAFSRQEADGMGLYPWISSVEEQKDSYFADDEALAKVSESKRDQILGDRLHAQLYYEMPLLLMGMEKELGAEVFWERLSGVYTLSQDSGSVSWDIFCTAMGVRKEEVRYERYYADFPA